MLAMARVAASPVGLLGGLDFNGADGGTHLEVSSRTRVTGNLEAHRVLSI
jgi:hypothetical protein